MRSRMGADAIRRRREVKVEIDRLIEIAEEQIKKLEGSGEVELGIVLLCALQLFKKEKALQEGGAECK